MRILARLLEPGIMTVMANEAKTMAEALDALRADRSTPVRARVAGLFVELRAIEENVAERSALEMFDEVGAWVGDDADEIATILAAGRGERPQRPPVEL